MVSILYYSNYCKNSKNLLTRLSRSKITEELHYLCVDQRVKANNGATYIVLSNGQQIMLPPTVTKVPALLLTNKGHHVLFGNQIYQHLLPRETEIEEQANKDSEPQCYSFGGGMCSLGVNSDQYSFLDMSSEDLAAKGNGGMRQLYNYSTIESGGQIETPPDTYSPDKLNFQDETMEKLRMEREQEIKL
jgi:hypothetical protein